MHDEDDRHKYTEFLCMSRNARFWDDLYDEVFRKHIRYGDDINHDIYQKVWDDISKYMEELRDE